MPAALKWIAGGGTAGFTVLALVLGAFWPVVLMAGIAGFQLLVLGWLGALIVRRPAGDLAPAEGATLDSLAVVIAVALPLLGTDFRFLIPDLPVRLGALAILVFVVAAVRLVTTGGRPTALAADLLVLTGGAALVTGGAAIAGVGDATGLVRIAAVAFSVGALLVCALRLGNVRREAGRQASLVSALAGLPHDAPARDVLGRHPDLAAGHVVASGGFGLYDEAALARILRAHPVTGSATPLDADDRQMIDDLLGVHAASHVVLCRDAPLQVLSVSMGALGGMARTEQELALLSRLLRAEAA